MAGRGLGTLTLDLILRMGGFEQGWDKAARISDKRMKEIGRSAKRMGVAIGVAVAAAGTIAADGIKSAIDYADQLNDMNQRLGVSAEALSGWAYAAKQSGTDIDALGIDLKKLAKNMAEALDPKSQQGMLFDALGVSVKDAQGNLRDVESVLPEIASKFKELDNATQESALAMDLFGKSGTDLIEFLNQGADGIAELRAEAREYGMELSGSTLRSADQFNDNLEKLRGAVNGAWNEIAAGMLPRLVEMSGAMAESAKQTDKLRQFGEGLVTVLGAIGSSFSFVIGLANRFGTDIGAASEALRGYQQIAANMVTGGLADGSITGGMRAIGNAKNTRQQILADQQKQNRLLSAEAALRNTIAGLKYVDYTGPLLEGGSQTKDSGLAGRVAAAYGPKASGGGKKKGSSGKSDAQREAEALQPSFKSMNDRLREQIDLFGAVGATANERYELEKGALAGLSPALKEQLTVQLDILDGLNAEKDAQEKLNEIMKERESAINRDIENGAALIEAMQFELSLLGMTNEQREREIALRQLGANATDEQRASVAALSAELIKGQKEAQAWEEFQSNLADTFFDVASGAKSLKDAVVDFFDALANQILRAAAENWAQQITDLFKGGASSGGASGSSGGGFWATAAQAFASFFAGGKASGGSVQAGQMYRVNELGTEMFSAGGKDYLLAGSSGRITPANKVGGGGVSVTQVFNNPRMYDRSSSAQREAEAAQKLKHAMRFA